MASRLHADAWTAPIGTDNGDTIPLPNATKEAALRMATAMLNRHRYIGRITNTAQALAWPRTGITDQEGRSILSTAIPPAIANATAELALYLLRHDLTDDRTRRGILSVRAERVGESAITFDGTAANDALPAIVQDLIAPFLATQGTSARLVP
jgi:hypothetical protein